MTSFAPLSEETYEDRSRYLEGHLAEVACLDCLATVRVRKQSEFHTSIQWDAEAIETAIRAYAGIEEHDQWPGGVPRPVPRDSYVARHQDVEYVVLRCQRTIVAVIDTDDGSYTVLKSWPKEIETR